MAVEYTETFEQILKDTSPQLPGVVRSVALRELRLTCREFFEKSYAWTKVVTSINASAGETPIQVSDGDAEAQVIGILGVEYSGVPLGAMPDRPPRAETSDLPFGWYVTSNPDELVLFPYLANASVGLLTVKVALTPSAATMTLPRQITLKFYDTIVDGFLARMYAQPSKPYSAPALAGQHRQRFVQNIGFYSAQRKQGFNNSANWRYPSGWGVGRVG